jgi:hypothetical protein
MTAPSFTVPTIGQPNSSEDADIANALQQIYDILNGNIDSSNIAAAGVSNAELASPTAGRYRTICAEVSCGFSAAQTTGTYVLCLNGKVNSAADTIVAGGPRLVSIRSADHAVTGMTTKLRLATWLAGNNTSMGSCVIKLGLYPITAVSGSATTLLITLGTVVTGTDVTLTAPSNSAVQQASSDITLPSDGVYALGMVISGANVPAGVGTSGYVSVQVRSV